MPLNLTPNAAIYYHPDGYGTQKPRLMGRHAAGEGFLKGFVQHTQAKELYCYCPSRSMAKAFHEQVKGYGFHGPVRWVSEERHATLAEVGNLFLPGPGLGPDAWLRRRLDQRTYSLTGVTHTTASHGAMEAILDLVEAPVQAWDALICTSQVVKQTVEALLTEREDYLRARVGAHRFMRPQLPVIPLGVDCIERRHDAAARKRLRAELRIGDDEPVVLFVGRLSFHAKAHPVPMYLALDEAARRFGRRVHLIQCGWFQNDFIERTFREDARTFCPQVQHHFLDGRDPRYRVPVWSAADIFCSLSDNLQETFGLTPIEAMAAGLPAVVSDWNGYKDTVRDGVDGFRIPTRMPAPGEGADLAWRHASGETTYDRYCGETSQLVSVDVKACADAFERLLTDPELRALLGEAGAQRARELFDWSVIVRSYETLWHELNLRRIHKAESVPRVGTHPAHPARPDPFTLFASYPTSHLRPETRLLATADAKSRYRSLLDAGSVSFSDYVLPPAKSLSVVLQHFAEGAELGPLLDSKSAGDARLTLTRAVHWALKYGLLEEAE
ncbi:glycosyltransferase family 4 protein [Allochromatium palmeri]|uniref:Glycosyltransferase n=1 Tax=Allochromatium palmeri TaxID=231048 RepID=A0A6N8EJ69_9GAMM|nr:glycosyltransferase family 4 protein [Allochromatium palmeri]MTW22766.1 glycosyltransferase [Allochromatium palmeri]